MDRNRETMTAKRSLFFDEWQSCLRAHYIHVIRTQDAVTEPTLRHVLLHTGLTEDELAALREQVQHDFNVAPLGEPFPAAPQAEPPQPDDALPPPEALAESENEDDDALPDEAQSTYDELVGAAPTEDDLRDEDDAEVIAEPPPEDEADVPYDERDDDAYQGTDEDAPDEAEEPPYEPPPSQLSMF